MENLNDENAIRDELLERTKGFFKMKSISDLMIEIGLARNFIALDTRIVGLFNKYFKLNAKVDKIQSNERLYRTIEEKLQSVCKEIGIELSLLDRMLFRFANKSAIEYILEFECF